jgi:hypothetical protein
MKKVIFDKQTKFGLTRRGVVGYLFTHSAHPGREFLVTRGTKRTPTEEDVQYNGFWYAFEYPAGTPVLGTGAEATTRKETYERALAKLHTITPEQLDERRENWRITFATAVLRSGATITE